jgi:hypothetical protein
MVFFGFHAARVLLPVESANIVAARHLGRPDRAVILLHSHCRDLFHSQKSGSSLQQCFVDVRGLHPGLWHDPPDGDLECLAWHYLLAGIIKAITAAISVLTAAMLIPLVPKVISLPERMQLRATEIDELAQAEAALKESLATNEAALRELADQKFALDQHAIVAVTDVEGTLRMSTRSSAPSANIPRMN